MTESLKRIPDDTLLHSRYRVISVIGSGGVATVYRAHDEQLGRDVALKIIKHGAVGSTELHRVEDEVRLIAGLSHSALVTLFDVVPDETSSTLVMQFVDGEDLSRRLARGAIEPRLVAQFGAAIAGALSFVHESGVMHRDVKPANILLPKNGPQPALLADFGIARLVDSASITATGTIIGTASYLSPEQARGSQLTGSTDVYSLGLVLLEALTGNRAFPGTALESIAARMSSDPEIPDTIDPEWADLLRGMLQRDPEKRPSADEVQTALATLDAPTRTLVMATVDAPTERLAAEAPTERLGAVQAASPAAAAVAPAPAPARAPASAQRSRRGLLIVGALLVLLLLAVTAYALAGRGDTSAAPSSTLPSEQSSVTPSAEPIVFPRVDGDLGKRLNDLQQAVGAVDDEAIARQLGEQVLVVSKAAAAGDYELARREMDELTKQVGDVTLSAAERESIVDEANAVIDELNSLIDSQPGNGNGKPDKKP